MIRVINLMIELPVDNESVTNFVWTRCLASRLYFGKKPKCKPDEGHPVQYFF